MWHRYVARQAAVAAVMLAVMGMRAELSLQTEAPARNRTSPPPATVEPIWRVHTDRKVVALTFDDGPDPTYTPQVLKLARDEGVKFTFFLIGRAVAAYPDLARREVAEGHVVGNHTWSHPLLTHDSSLGKLAEITRCAGEIRRACGVRTRLFRPPKGRWDGDAFREAEGLGYQLVLWTITLEHHDAPTPRAMADRVLRHLTPGMIILAHDGEPRHPLSRSKTMAAVRLLVNGLHERGYRLVTVPELLEVGKRP